MPETVVLVHGIWLNGLVMRPLARRLRRCGYRTVLFDYRSLLQPLEHNARRLARTLHALGTAHVHLVGHSLGGLVILRALQEEPALGSGRVVLLGSPVSGSVVARRLYRLPVTRWLIGRSGPGALLGGGPRWRGGPTLGRIAGTRPVGIGRLLGRLAGPNDGTVALAETVLGEGEQALTLPTTHLGLVFSPRVARAVCVFLREGRFPAGVENA